MSKTKQPTPDDIDITSLFGAVRRAFFRLLMATALVGIAAYAVLSTIAPRYTSEAQLSISAKRTNPFPEKPNGSATLAPRLDKQAINTHVRSLMAPDLIRKVATQLNLQKRVEFNSALGSLDTWAYTMRLLGMSGPARGETAEERVLRVAYNQLSVFAAHESRFISLKFSSADPVLAANFVNHLANTYRENLVSMPVQETSDVVAALQPKVEQLRQELINAEAEVERFRADTDQFKTGSQNASVNERRMSVLTDELARAEAANSEAEARWKTARELLRSGSADVLPEVQKSPLIQNLISQRVSVEREHSEAAISLLPYHPRMRQLTANLKKIRQQIDSEIRKVVKSLEKDFRTTRLRADAAAVRVGKLKKKVAGTSGNEAKLRALESTARSKRTELERLQKQLEDNKTLVNIRQVPVEAQIVSVAHPTSVPTFPKKSAYTLLAMAATFLLGLAWIIFRELVSGAYGSADRPRANHIPHPHQGTSSQNPASEPTLPAPTDGPHKAITVSTAASKGHTMAEIASRIAEREGVTSGYRTLLAGSLDRRASLHPAIQLASQLTGRGQTALIVDWKLSGSASPGLASAASAPGMMELLANTASFEDAIQQIPGSTIQLIAPGGALENVDALLEPSQVNLILDVLDEAYDHVIIAADTHDARRLFETIEGRVDAGIELIPVNNDVSSDSVPDASLPGCFLGFEVEGIELFRYHAPTTAPQPHTASKKKQSAVLRRA